MLRFIALMAALVAMMATLSLPGHGQLRKGGGTCAQQYSSCLKRCDKTPDRKNACTERCQDALIDCELGPSGPGAGPGGPGPGAGGPGGGAAPTPQFILRMCNKTSDVPVIFITTASVVGQQFRAQGWTQVPQGQCVQVGSFQRPTVWWHGRAPNGTTWGDAKSGIDLCVNLNGGFDFTWDGSGRQCAQGEAGVPFMKLDIAPNVNTFDMNLN